LILLGVFLRSMHSEQTNWTFEDTLTQIGLGYPFLFLLGFRSAKFLYITTAIILFLYWLAFALYPLPGDGFDYNLVGVTKDWEYNLSGFAAHWNKNTNMASAFDQWFLNLFPREKLFVRNGGGYLTLSFIPTLCTMILGLIAGQYLKSENTFKLKYRNFLLAGIALILLGLLLNFTGFCPIVKRIWTPAWVLFSGGICFLFLVLFMKLTESEVVNKYLYWLKVIGMNSIAAYVLAHTITNFIHETFEINIAKNYDEVLGKTYESLVSGTVVLLVLWLILNWMYKRKIFLKI
jgi:predicted acyltransferase